MSPTELIALLSPALIKTPNPTRWADLGCGRGLFTFALATLLQPGSTIFAVDRHVDRHSTLRYRRTPNQVAINVVETDFVQDPLPFHNLDGILMANSLHYVADKSSLIRSLRTSNLKKQHTLVIVEYDTDQPISPWVPYPISYASLNILMHAEGYSSIIRIADRPSIYSRDKIYSALVTG